MWIVKLGGSLTCSEHLRYWLRALAGAGSLVVVPGGGPFADQVRLAQRQCGFDDSTAHYMALLAMEQYGTMLCGLQTGFAPASSVEQVQALLARGDTPVWMPVSMVMQAPEIAHSWDITSDSLAAWLAGTLGAAQLLLVKSVALDSATRSLEELTGNAVVDPRFGGYLRQFGLPAWMMSASDHPRFETLRRGDMAAATRILPATV
jgi:5-(aminomethyl)-3-furanmethanol phosphate kinase